MANPKRKILILSFSDLKHDARVNRQVDFLKESFDLEVVCFGANDTPGVQYNLIAPTPLPFIKKVWSALLLYTRFYQQAYRQLHQYQFLAKQYAQHEFDLIIANDIESLPLAHQLANCNTTTRKQNATPVFLDAHEYAPRHFEDKKIWRMFFQGFNIWMCKKYLPKTKGMSTVCEGLAKEYQKQFNVAPIVITNAPPYHEIQPQLDRKNPFRMIHHGVANRSRKLEKMFEIMDLLDDRFTLDLMLVLPPSASAKTKEFFQELKNKAQHNARISFIEPVQGHEIVDKIKEYDIGLFYLEPINFNYKHALPNKLFEFIQARLVVAISPSIEMKQVVEQYNCGIVGDSFSAESMAKKLNALDVESVKRYKQNAQEASPKISAEHNKSKLIQYLNTLLTS